MFRWLLLLPLVCLLTACGSNIRRDWAGGGGDGTVDILILQDSAAVEISIREGALIYDLRDYNAWAQGHVPGARRLNLDDLKRGRALPLDRRAPIVFMGDGPMDMRPERAADLAIEQGYSNVQLFPGGWRAWIGAHPIRD